MTKLTVNRTGEFNIAGCDDGPQCGSTISRHYRYLISLTGDENNLDSEGFVLDNALCDSYFREKYEGQNIEAISCENMAIAAIGHFRKVKKSLVRIKVTIWGSDKSYIEGLWEV